MASNHQIVALELGAIADIGPYGQQIVDAINSVGLVFCDDQYFVDQQIKEDAPYKPLALFNFFIDPPRRFIAVNADLVEDLVNALITVEHLAHEGIHALQAILAPELFDPNDPNNIENEIKTERQAYVDSAQIALLTAIKYALSVPGDFVTNLSELPKIQAWKNYDHTKEIMISAFLNRWMAGFSVAETLSFIRKIHAKVFDQIYIPKTKAPFSTSLEAPRTPDPRHRQSGSVDIKGSPKDGPA